MATRCEHNRRGQCSRCFLHSAFALEEDDSGAASYINSPITKIDTDIVVAPTSPSPSIPSPMPSPTPLDVTDPNISTISPTEARSNQQSSLLRLFKSEVLTPFMSVQYLYTAKEPGVLAFLCNRLFDFDPRELDFYLPQLINMYLNMAIITEVLTPYLIYRCKESVDFALQTVWLLDAFGLDTIVKARKHMKNSKFPPLQLKQAIMNDEFRKQNKSVENKLLPKKNHARSHSDATTSYSNIGSIGLELKSNDQTESINTNPPTTPANCEQSDVPQMSSMPSRFQKVQNKPRSMGSRELASGFAFTTPCICGKKDKLSTQATCNCGSALSMRGEEAFVHSFMKISDRIMAKSSTDREQRTHHLMAELSTLNLNLPARVWLPLYSHQLQVKNHQVLRINPKEACLLNSKDKAPFCAFVEVSLVDSVYDSPLIPKLNDASKLSVRSANNNIIRTTRSIDNLSMMAMTTASYEPNVDERSYSPPLLQLNPHNEWLSATPTIPDSISVLSMDSGDAASMSTESQVRTVPAGEIRRRLANLVSIQSQNKQFKHSNEDPSASAMSEPWADKVARIRKESPYGHLPSWQLLPVIIKTGDDLRQELLAYQLLVQLQIIWQEEMIPLWLRPFRILVTSKDSGMMEPIVNAVSLHQIKKHGGNSTLFDYFQNLFGPPTSEAFLEAQKNLVHSCAAYCLACYFLQVKDRHNGNILLDTEGHLIHIDFGYILTISPKNLGFESSPFKLTQELIDVMGGADSDMFNYFKTLMFKGLIAARKHNERIITLVEMMMCGGSPLPCFRGGTYTIRGLKQRFHEHTTDEDLHRQVELLVEQSRASWTTRMYDNFQYFTNGIL